MCEPWAKAADLQGGAHLLCGVELGREAKIGDLDLASGVEEDVTRLDVTVHLRRFDSIRFNSIRFESCEVE